MLFAVAVHQLNSAIDTTMPQVGFEPTSIFSQSFKAGRIRPPPWENCGCQEWMLSEEDLMRR